MDVKTSTHSSHKHDHQYDQLGFSSVFCGWPTHVNQEIKYISKTKNRNNNHFPKRRESTGRNVRYSHDKNSLTNSLSKEYTLT